MKWQCNYPAGINKKNNRTRSIRSSLWLWRLGGMLKSVARYKVERSYHTNAFPKPSWSPSNPVFSRRLRGPMGTQERLADGLIAPNCSQVAESDLGCHHDRSRLIPVWFHIHFLLDRVDFELIFWLLSKAAGGGSHASGESSSLFELIFAWFIRAQGDTNKNSLLLSPLHMLQIKPTVYISWFLWISKHQTHYHSGSQPRDTH